MSTRAMIAVQLYDNGPYYLFYRHNDGYPKGLGQELVDSLNRGIHLKGVDELMEYIGAEPRNRVVSELKEVYTKIQGDLEWIYVLRNAEDKDSISLEILKICNRHSKRPYLFLAFWSYRKFLNQTVNMKTVQYVTSTIMRALGDFEKMGVRK